MRSTGLSKLQTEKLKKLIKNMEKSQLQNSKCSRSVLLGESLIFAEESTENDVVGLCTALQHFLWTHSHRVHYPVLTFAQSMVVLLWNDVRTVTGHSALER